MDLLLLPAPIMSSSPFFTSTNNGADEQLYGSLRNSSNHLSSTPNSTGGRKTASVAIPLSRTSRTERTALTRGHSTDSTLDRLTRHKRKSRAVSSRSRLLLLPSFAESWRIEQQALMAGNDDNDNDAPTETHHHLEQSTWVHAASIVVGEILGSGVLGLPGAFADLGYVLGTLSCMVFCYFAIYSGQILARVKNEYYPGTESYADAATHTCSAKAAFFTRWAVHVNWLFLLPYYLMTIAHSLELAFGTYLCFYQYTLMAAGVLLIFLQFRTLAGLAYAAMISDVAIIGAIVMIVWCIVTNNGGEGNGGGNSGNGTGFSSSSSSQVTSFPSSSFSSSSSSSSFSSFSSSSSYSSSSSPSSISSPSSSLANTTTLSDPWWPSPGTFLQVYGRTSSIVFAFQGQSIYFEIMREMQDSRHFGKAVTVANGLMGSIYLITCVLVTVFR